jgi:molybdate transport system regulatory protein
MAAPVRKRSQRPPKRLELQGSLWIAAGAQNLGGHGRIALLRAVGEQGSITHAAKACGMSYKAAWEAIDTMTTLSGQPLVERTTGGRGGGHTQLTERGRQLVERYTELDAAHQRFVRLLDESGMNLDQAFSPLRVLHLKTSARNQWLGTVTSMRSGAVNDEVEITLPGGEVLAAIVTRGSSAALGLQTRQSAIAMVKASAVMLATQADGARLSARNRLDCVVREVVPGAANDEVTLDSDRATAVVAVVPRSTRDELALRPGARVCAFVKASDVIVAVAG